MFWETCLYAHLLRVTWQKNDYLCPYAEYEAVASNLAAKYEVIAS